MTTFISGGHHLGDSGAVSSDGKVIEFAYCASFRDLVEKELRKIRPDIKIITDRDSETLGQYLARIKTGTGSVAIEFHLNSFSKSSATGAEALIADKHTKESRAMAVELAAVTAEAFGIHNRGVKTESQSARKKLAFTRIAGTVVLLELGFISNPVDLERMLDECRQKLLAKDIAIILAKYEDML